MNNQLIRALSLLGTAGCFFESADLWVELIGEHRYFDVQLQDFEQLIRLFSRCDTNNPPPDTEFGPRFCQFIVIMKIADEVLTAIKNNDVQAENFDIRSNFRAFYEACYRLIAIVDEDDDDEPRAHPAPQDPNLPAEAIAPKATIKRKDLIVDRSDLEALLSLLAGAVFHKLLQLSPQNATNELMLMYECFRERSSFDMVVLDTHQTHMVLQSILN